MKGIELTNGMVYLAKEEPTSPTGDKLSDKDLVILDLIKQIEALKQSENVVLDGVVKRHTCIMNESEALYGRNICCICKEDMPT